LKTVVYQSYRTTNVPAWLGRCMKSVRDWASAAGFEYRFYDDAFFDLCPDWYRRKVGHDVLMMSDLARLLAARDLLAQGQERTIWIDADVLIFDPQAFAIDVTERFAFCRELWVNRKGPKFVGWERVNNAICVFVAGNSFLEFYIDACQTLVRMAQKPDKRLLGPILLTRLSEVLPLQLIGHVGTFNPLLMEHLARGDDRPLRAYRDTFGSPMHAANLCSSFRGEVCQGVSMCDEIYERVVDRMLGQSGLSGRV
jgi:hypothetical protein